MEKTRPRFGILGPLEVVRGGDTLDVGHPKQRAVLALLVINANRVVPTDRLVDELWGGSAPAQALASLQAYISNLRRVLEPDRARRSPATIIVTQAPGYVLHSDPGNIDAVSFERTAARGRALLNEGRAADAARALHEALAIWRGPALAEFTYESFAQAEIARLKEVRLSTLEHRIDADLACGNHAAVTAELESLVDVNPLRERLRAQLMLALYRSGRQAEALSVYQAGRRMLVEEMGIDPGPSLRILEQRILEQSPTLDASPVSPARASIVADAPSALVGRSMEQSALNAALGYAAAGQGRLVLVSGEPGIGKTRLVEAFTESAVASGYAVAWGTCVESERPPPFWPWIELLRVVVGRPNELAGPDRARLAQLLPDLDAGPPPGEVTHTETERFDLYDGVRSLLIRQADRAPVICVFDDLHWADTASLRLLQFVATDVHARPLLIIGTFRSTEIAADHPFADTLADLARRSGTLRVHLTGFSVEEAGQYIELISGRTVPRALVAAVHHRSEGNPFFVAELVRSIAGGDAIDDGRALRAAEEGIPAGVRDLIRRRVAKLGEPAGAVLKVAAVIGREFALDVLQRASLLSSNDVLDSIDAALVTGLVVADRSSPGNYRFAHALVREAIYDDIPELRRARVHAAAGDAIAQLRWSASDQCVADLALHYGHAIAVGYGEKALEAAAAAADRASARLAYDEAAGHLGTALSALHTVRPADAVRRYELLCTLGTARRRAGDLLGCRSALRDASLLAEAIGDAERQARAAANVGGFTVFVGLPYGMVDREAVEMMERALHTVGNDQPELVAQIKANLSLELFYADDPSRRDTLSAEAVEIARASGDPQALARALYCRFVARWDPDGLEIRRSAAEELLAIRDETVPAEVELLGRFFKAVSALEGADVDVADAECTTAASLADRLRMPHLRTVLLLHRSMRCTLEGRLEDADELRASADVLQREMGYWQHRNMLIAQRFMARREEGRALDLEEFLRDPDRLRAPGSAEMLALALLEGRRDSEAEDSLERSTDAEALPRDHLWLAIACLQAEARSRLGQGERCGSLYHQLEPFAGRIAVAGGAVMALGAVDHFLGQLAHTCGRDDVAEAHYRDAIALNEKVRALPWAARSRLGLAALLLQLRADATNEARDLVEGAEAIGRRCRLPAVLEQARALTHAIKKAVH